MLVSLALVWVDWIAGQVQQLLTPAVLSCFSNQARLTNFALRVSSCLYFPVPVHTFHCHGRSAPRGRGSGTQSPFASICVHPLSYFDLWWTVELSVFSTKDITGLHHYLALIETCRITWTTSAAFAFLNFPCNSGRRRDYFYSLKWCFTPVSCSHLNILFYEFHSVSATHPTWQIIVVYRHLRAVRAVIEELDILLSSTRSSWWLQPPEWDAAVLISSVPQQVSSNLLDSILDLVFNRATLTSPLLFTFPPQTYSNRSTTISSKVPCDFCSLFSILSFLTPPETSLSCSSVVKIALSS